MKRIIALSCLAAVMLAGCGKTEKDGTDSKSETTTKATEAVTTEAPEEETTEALTTAAETSAEAATAPETTKEPDGMVSAGGRMDMYPAIYQGVIKSKFDETVNRNEGNASIEYAFRDLDADGIPELLLKYGTCEADYQIHIYTLDDEAGAKDLGLYGGGHTSFAYDKNTGDFVIVWGHMGAASIIYYKWENGTLKSNGSYDFNLDEEITSYDQVLEEKGIRYIDHVYVSSFGMGDDAMTKTYVYHANGESEEYDGLNLDYMG
ncbi:MAG: hypothetical protein K5898_16535 [Ruminococcus sp.]|uniref:hypothetical protein n=1 Tax=Ruminococcus sp. TaxID=41978 RepID=UPI0025DEF1C8|nr:hypothetical protein [Ruminococcus sp.]MCR4796748.1 hypothetical protein [Ruminococcus sp.]